MHELSIAQSLMEVALENLPPDAGRVTAVHLQLGVLSGVEQAALQFGYEVVTAGTPLAGSALIVHDVPVRVYCTHCEQEAEVQNPYRLRCPQCDQPCGDLRSGKELYLSALDLAEDQGVKETEV